MIQQADAVTAPSGATKEQWYLLASVVWMSKRDVRGDERLKMDMVSAKFDSLWEMGYRPDMDPELVDVAKLRRLVYQDRIYQIVFATQLGRREGIQIASIVGTGKLG